MKLTKNKKDGWIAGVCAGIADKTGIHISLIRIISFFVPFGFLLYVVLALVMDDKNG
jgi:phage shock protein PspC (stress-responsive transcriptional regulator)